MIKNDDADAPNQSLMFNVNGTLRLVKKKLEHMKKSIYGPRQKAAKHRTVTLVGTTSIIITSINILNMPNYLSKVCFAAVRINNVIRCGKRLHHGVLYYTDST